MSNKKQYQKEIRLWVDVTLELLAEDCAQLDQTDIEQLRRSVWEVAGPITQTIRFERGGLFYRGTVMFDYPTPYDMKQARLDAVAGRKFEWGQGMLVLNAADFGAIDAMELSELVSINERSTSAQAAVTVGKAIAPIRGTIGFAIPSMYELKIARLAALAGKTKMHSSDLVA